ncbi:hypothetical protein A3J20_05490 [Candidatus Gottesmanbacteria bacterium RIFCSPLOWO2_02_FULL_42_29]|uniref:Membrane protein 6-pyruvoyl-tetrahydropterin synthase-related domain-containing protein n=2 Tax=Candidatus Gottesmaniibacteriota TaxID=1752720 RepID=A0A0G1HKU6_9BACT|nr:MAG: hypothetical protein UW37_C0006G0008 [Candidatus Gottesmanbacteria bacterium GW2011_GWA2_44_17]OGG12255.1 MAG: hypothetical protein A2781_02345 [Candidatus Gottesmanbacteria bacterium RIFCSPHIGHO2_01_FULL_42_27]OGG22417.1 MAG: hypothetical protein A3E72_01020 [Candidatus Gottesmanbacteria bacterium RIFCSPHIGHO2_12_FULL_43_26]OGG35962.1 MAG: hypothetical protein A2968_03585 [Candidatus Gottesmanbacteria bacterium RIFCSPLOWO2_01_FULL_42_22]OGG39360.1 MAG: hypothetical protein A3J20_05490 
MSIFRRKITPHSICLLIYHLVLLLIAIINFPYGKYFIGWDALNPEFNFALNFQRVFSAFWQENQGLGLLGGHGFAAVLPHNIIAYVISRFLPIQAIRPAITFLFLYLGGLGMYFLSVYLLRAASIRRRISIPMGFYFPSLLAALFYVLNLGTIQMFYIQLEAFIFHFAALPWLFYVLLSFLENRTRGNFLIFLFVNFFASAQGFIPPLFVAYTFAFMLILATYLSLSRFSLSSVKTVVLMFGATLIINAYWLIPLGYYSLTRSSVYLNSYNNLISTPEFIEKNRKYGTLKDVALIKGFIWEGMEHIVDNKIRYVYQPWIDHHRLFAVPLAGYLFFGISAIGVVVTIAYFRSTILAGFALIYLFFFTGLTTDTFPFSLITALLQKLPIYRQAFRAAFTKFSIGVSFSYSLFLGIGLAYLSVLIFRMFRRQQHAYSLRMKALLTGILLSLLFLYAFPAFRGAYLYRRLTINLPDPYREVQSFFSSQPNGRIAELPIDCPEGWYNYRWGYTGSGFYWYGIRQPILSRTFDVWSNSNENYYWEMVQALRERNNDKIDALLTKYDTKWILYDPNVSHCRNAKGFQHLDSYLEHLATTANFRKIKQFSGDGILPIRIYEKVDSAAENYLKLVKKLPNIGPEYNWNDDDTAYFHIGDYLTDTSSAFNDYYPFRSLFTRRKFSEMETRVRNSESSFTFANTIPNVTKKSRIMLPKYRDLESIIPVTLTFRQFDQGLVNLSALYHLPDIGINGSTILNEFRTPENLGTVKTSGFGSVKAIVNGEVVEVNELLVSVSTIFSTSTDNSVIITDKTNRILFSWTSGYDQHFNELINSSESIPVSSDKTVIEVTFDKIRGNNSLGVTVGAGANGIYPKNCNDLLNQSEPKFELITQSDKPVTRLISSRNEQCLIYNFDRLSTAYSYLGELETENIKGNKPYLIVSNRRRVHYLDLEVDIADTSTNQFFILPASFKTEFGYDVYLYATSILAEESVNDFTGLSLWYFPLNYLKNITVSEGSFPVQDQENTSFISETLHPNEVYYEIRLERKDDSVDGPEENYLLLSQSYDDGWKAYIVECQNQNIKCIASKLFPFIFGKELKHHILVNNWKNGWLLSENDKKKTTTVILVFQPQYLGYFGFALWLLLPLTVFSIPKVHKHS